MGETLTERRRVDEEGRKVVKSFCRRRITVGVERQLDDVSLRISPGQLRASSRGNTYGASVVRKLTSSQERSIPLLILRLQKDFTTLRPSSSTRRRSVRVSPIAEDS